MEENVKKQSPPGAPNNNKWRFLAERVMMKHGRPPKFTVNTLLEQFQSFVEYYSENKTVYRQRSKQRKGQNGQEAQAERTECAAPMTEISFCVWLGVHKAWMTDTLYSLRNLENPSPAQSEFLDVLERIRTFLNSQLVEGAILGEYTPIVVCSLLGLKNNVDVTSGGKGVGAPVINLVADTKTREDYQKERDAQ